MTASRTGSILCTSTRLIDTATITRTVNARLALNPPPCRPTTLPSTPQVAHHLSEQAPASLLRPSLAPWRGGALSLDGVIARLRDLLPPTFEDLPCDFAVGVVTSSGEHLLIDSGPLPEAVAASAAIPYIFEAVHVPGTSEQYGLLQDGGCADRIGLRSWRQRRRAQAQQQLQHAYTRACTTSRATTAAHGGTSSSGDSTAAVPGCLVHVIGRSSPFSGADDAVATGEKSLLVVHSPKAQANLTDLGSFQEHMEASRARALPELLRVRSSGLKEVVRVAAGSNGGASTAAAAAAGGHVASGYVGVEASGGSGSGSVGGLAAPPLEWFNVAMSSMDSVMSMERVWAARRMEP